VSVSYGTRFQNEAGPGHLLGGFSVAHAAPEVPPDASAALQKEGHTPLGEKWREILSTFHVAEQLAASDKQPIIATDETAAIVASLQTIAESKPPSVSISSLHALSNTINADGLFPRASIARREKIATAANAPHPNRIAHSDRRGGMDQVEKLSAKIPHPHDNQEKTTANPQAVAGRSGTASAVTSEMFVAPISPLIAPLNSEQLHERRWFGNPSDAKDTNQTAASDGSFRLPRDASSNPVRGDKLQSPEGIEVESADPKKIPHVPSSNSSLQVVADGAHEEGSPKVEPTAESVERDLRAQDYHVEQVAWPRHSSVPDAMVSAVQESNSIHEGSIALQPTGPSEVKDASVAPLPKDLIPQQKPTAPRDPTSATRVTANPTFRAAHSLDPLGISSPFMRAHEEAIAQTYVAENAALPRPAIYGQSIQRSEQGETFAAIDAGNGVPDSHWTLASSHRAEADFQDPVLGWVTVRAQAGAGSMHATIAPASDTAAQVLNTHLAGLNAHMAPQYQHLNPVTLASPNAGSNDQNTQEHSGQRGSTDSSQSQEHQGQQDSQPVRRGGTQRVSPRIAGVETGSAETSRITDGQNSGGHYVSVIV
jgi:hypothetical protein